MDESLELTFVEQNGIKNIRWTKDKIIAEGIQKNASFIMRISKKPDQPDESSAIAHLKKERILKSVAG